MITFFLYIYGCQYANILSEIIVQCSLFLSSYENTLRNIAGKKQKIKKKKNKTK